MTALMLHIYSPSHTEGVEQVRHALLDFLRSTQSRLLRLRVLLWNGDRADFCDMDVLDLLLFRPDSTPALSHLELCCALSLWQEASQRVLPTVARRLQILKVEAPGRRGIISECPTVSRLMPLLQLLQPNGGLDSLTSLTLTAFAINSVEHAMAREGSLSQLRHLCLDDLPPLQLYIG